MYKIHASYNGNNSALHQSTFHWSNSYIDHLHDGFILLILVVQIRPFVVFNLAGISKFIYEGKNQMNSVSSSEMTPSCKWPGSLMQTSARQSLSTRQYPYHSAIVTMTMYCKKLVFLLITHILVIFFSGIRSYLGLTTS